MRMGSPNKYVSDHSPATFEGKPQPRSWWCSRPQGHQNSSQDANGSGAPQGPVASGQQGSYPQMPGDLQGLVGTYHDISILIHTYVQWSFQEPKLEVPTIYKAYFLGLNFREYPHKIWPEIWYSRTSINWILLYSQSDIRVGEISMICGGFPQLKSLPWLGIVAAEDTALADTKPGTF